MIIKLASAVAYLMTLFVIPSVIFIAVGWAICWLLTQAFPTLIL